MKTLHHKLGPARREKLRAPVKRVLPFYSSPEWLALKAKVIGRLTCSPSAMKAV